MSPGDFQRVGAFGSNHSVLDKRPPPRSPALTARQCRASAAAALLTLAKEYERLAKQSEANPLVKRAPSFHFSQGIQGVTRESTQRAGSPNFPPKGELLVPQSTKHLKILAWECRQLAAATGHKNTRRELLEIAAKFEHLAKVRER